MIILFLFYSKGRFHNPNIPKLVVFFMLACFASVKQCFVPHRTKKCVHVRGKTEQQVEEKTEEIVLVECVGITKETQQLIPAQCVGLITKNTVPDLIDVVFS